MEVAPEAAADGRPAGVSAARSTAPCAAGKLSERGARQRAGRRHLTTTDLDRLARPGPGHRSGGRGGARQAGHLRTARPDREATRTPSWRRTRPPSRSSSSRRPPTVPSRSSDCTSSTRCRCYPWSSWSPSLLTGDETTEFATTFAPDRLAKKVIHSQDRAGFIVNALLIPYLLSAIRMLESGFATAADIDSGMVDGLRPSDGTAGPGRPHRPRHHPGHRQLVVRGVPRAAVRAAAAAVADDRRGPPRPEGGPGLSHVP